MLVVTMVVVMMGVDSMLFGPTAVLLFGRIASLVLRRLSMVTAALTLCLFLLRLCFGLNLAWFQLTSITADPDDLVRIVDKLEVSLSESTLCFPLSFFVLLLLLLSMLALVLVNLRRASRLCR